MSKLNLGKDLYIRGRIGWRGLSKDEYLKKSEYKIINATALMDGFIDWNNCGFISKERYEESYVSRKSELILPKERYEESDEIMLEENDILISKDGTLGKIGYVKDMDKKCTIASGIFLIRNTKPNIVNFDYLYHILKSNIFKDFIRRNKAEGSTINHLYQRDLVNFEIELPTIDEQNKIARVLNAIDNIIANNNKIISELENMAKMIYDYWFLQFEFPNEKGKPYKSSGGKMFWNEKLKKEIPEGWKYKKIEEIADNIITGKTPSTKDEKNFNGNIPFITIDDIRQGLYVFNTVRTLSEKGANSQIKKYIPKDSICVTCIATVGLVGITTKDSQTNQQINSVICKNKNNLYYLVNAIKEYFEYSSGAKSGNIFDNMNKEDFASIKLIYPTEDVLEKYKDKVKPIYNKIKNCILENEELIKLREYLLPLLMNGQVKIENKN